MSLTRLDVLLWLSAKRAQLFLGVSIVIFLMTVCWVLGSRFDSRREGVSSELAVLRKEIDRLNLDIGSLNRRCNEMRDRVIQIAGEETGRGFDGLSRRVENMRVFEPKSTESR